MRENAAILKPAQGEENTVAEKEDDRRVFVIKAEGQNKHQKQKVGRQVPEAYP